MARFTVRVELHDATWKDYARLYDQLAAKGFTDVIVGSKDVKHKLPPAEYNYDGLASAADVLNKAKAAAEVVGRKYAVLVTESAGRVWHNLDKG